MDNSAILSTLRRWRADSAQRHYPGCAVRRHRYRLGMGRQRCRRQRGVSQRPPRLLRLSGQPRVYDSPTLHRRVLVAYNRIHGIKRVFHDGGAILQPVLRVRIPSSRRTTSTIFRGESRCTSTKRSRYITVRENVVDGAGVWLTVNTLNDYRPLRASTDNKAVGNWYTESKITGSWDRYQQQHARSQSRGGAGRVAGGGQSRDGQRGHREGCGRAGAGSAR